MVGLHHIEDLPGMGGGVPDADRRFATPTDSVAVAGSNVATAMLRAITCNVLFDRAGADAEGRHVRTCARPYGGGTGM